MEIEKCPKHPVGLVRITAKFCCVRSHKIECSECGQPLKLTFDETDSDCGDPNHGTSSTTTAETI